ncbi:MAG: D-isomer specific 2-hydroxyacid dehydrogenase NAD-binding protein [Parcubacteria group bacterium GW2011_GWB1_46_8]|nr:MAG: D-isomer specific 2-hydroxyacid dehydrogenase NAD-binding protein [Parcubacteria group bacterium GW2011_GWA1_45_7]KKU44004.1 MAG: D-isomer specific 2-hydroxyacid dehydrogenase NAD-binding protein [Parcubacteria group bacterium GW2011_GWA2_46_7]KKU46160.1 MAG: D-isomer specific 2-hydroxyacid dehydrogenase NAD-binding protein [Parcubacteria group bacterium GW2011_GWB1_46_8]
MKIAFFETTGEDQKYIRERLADQGLSLLFFETPFHPDLLVDASDIGVLSVFIGSKVSLESIEKFPQLKLITTRSTGFDHLAVGELNGRGIRLGYVPGYGDNTVAEFAMGLVLAVVRKIPFAFHRIRVEGVFSAKECAGFDLMGKTMGVVGTGRIGKHMVRISRGIGMNVIAYDAHPDEAFSKEISLPYVSLPELLAQSDVISLHVPYMPETHHLINEEAFAAMKPGAVLINTARGGIIDTHALLQALQGGKLGGFGADVLEGEEHVTDEGSFLLYGQRTKENVQTLAENLVFVDLPNVVVTPHIAFYTREALERILNADIKNILSFLETNSLVYDIMASKRLADASSQGGDIKH